VALLPHHLEHVAVADRRAAEHEAEPAEEALEPEIGHDRAGDAAAARRSPSAQERAISAMIWSPSIAWPCSSTMIRRSASPSSAMPQCAPCATTCSCIARGSVAPQPLLMLKPSGSTPIGT